MEKYTASLDLMERDGEQFGGLHVIIDIFGADRLNDIKYIENTMYECIKECDATLLNIYLHEFKPTNGVTGVACLAESHISVHTWPEHNHAAFDIFMCGESEPEKAVAIIEKRFNAESSRIEYIKRGSGLATK